MVHVPVRPSPHEKGDVRRAVARGRLAFESGDVSSAWVRGTRHRHRRGHAGDGVVLALSTVPLPVDRRCCGQGMANPSDNGRHRPPAAQTNIAPFKSMQRGASGTTRRRPMKRAMFRLCRVPSETAPFATRRPPATLKPIPAGSMALRLAGLSTLCPWRRSPMPKRRGGQRVDNPLDDLGWRAVVHHDGCASVLPRR